MDLKYTTAAAAAYQQLVSTSVAKMLETVSKVCSAGLSVGNIASAVVLPLRLMGMMIKHFVDIGGT